MSKYFESNIFKTKEVKYIDDCRVLNYAECIGLITNGIVFKKFNIINKYDFDYLFLDEFFGGQIRNYTMRCLPETKEMLITFNSYYTTQYEIHFVPKDTYIKINIISGDKRIAYVDYSVEELEDLFM